MSKIPGLFLLCFSFFSMGTIHAQWSIEKSPTTNNLNSISLNIKNSYWIAGDNGTILHNKNGEWKQYKNPATENLYGIYMISEKDGWAVGAKGTILHFDDENWKPVTGPTDKKLFSVYFKDSDNGVVVGELGTILIYTNGIWSAKKNDIKGDLFTAFSKDEDVWIAGGLECVNIPIMKIGLSKGAGHPDSFDSFASIYSVFFLNSDDGWAVGSPSTLLHFNGVRWVKPIIDYKFPSLKSVYFSKEKEGICVGYSGTILTYSDNKWTMENSPSSHNLRAAAAVENTFYAVGDSGTILRKNKISGNSRMSALEIINERIDLFPNPCDNILNLKLAFENYQPVVRIIITAPNGQVVVQKNLYAWNSNPTCQISTSELKNGLYNLQVIIGAKSRTAKFIIMH